MFKLVNGKTQINRIRILIERWVIGVAIKRNGSREIKLKQPF